MCMDADMAGSASKPIHRDELFLVIQQQIQERSPLDQLA
jgi:hypothetical protein